MATKRRPPRRGGRPRGRAEEKYIGIRTLFSPTNFDSFINDERYAQTLHMALRKEFGSNNAETLATMKLGGFLETFKKNLKFHATRKDMQRFFRIVEKNRIDKKFGLSKREATARFFADQKYKPISKRRPSDYEAKPGTIYRPKPGSSIGKVRVKQIGAVKTEKEIRKVMEQLFMLFEGAFKPKAGVSKNVSVKRTFKK
tara:strand:- start:37 stop:633 length:597 start_codon:yes stop_codon:yes gene_type:complete